MKRYIVLIFISSLLFAVKSVPRTDNKDKDNESTKIKVVDVEKTVPDSPVLKKEKAHDHFQDVDSNSVNDQREDDFQKIKSLFKNLFKKEKPDHKEEIKKPSRSNNSKTKD